MEHFKKPEMIIALITAAALVGSSGYFYKKQQGLEEEINKIQDNLATNIKMVREFSTYGDHIRQLATAIKELNAHINSQRNIMDDYRTILDSHQDSFEIIVNALKEQGLDLKLPRSYFSRPDPYELDHRRRSDYQHDHRTTHNYPREAPLIAPREPLREPVREPVRDYPREPARDYPREPARDYPSMHAREYSRPAPSRDYARDYARDQHDEDEEIRRQVENVRQKQLNSAPRYNNRSNDAQALSDLL